MITIESLIESGEIRPLTIEEIEILGLEKFYYPNKGIDWNPFWYCSDNTVNITDSFAGCWTYDPVTREMTPNFQ